MDVTNCLFFCISDFVSCICLPYEDAVEEEYQGVKLTVAAWGVTDIYGRYLITNYSLHNHLGYVITFSALTE